MKAKRVKKLDKLAVAQARAAEICGRNFPKPCACKECEIARNLPAVLRILAAKSQQLEAA